MNLRSEIWNFKNAVEVTFAPHCSTGLLKMTFHPSNYPASDLKRFRSLRLSDAGHFSQRDLLTRKSYRMRSRRLSTRLYETVENMSGALNSVQKPEREFCGSLFADPH